MGQEWSFRGKKLRRLNHLGACPFQSPKPDAALSPEVSISCSAWSRFGSRRGINIAEHWAEDASEDVARDHAPPRSCQ
jgi:hypothetical protein